MKPMSEKQISRWEKERAKGKNFYVVKNAITWSIWMVIASSLAEYIYDGQIRQSSVTISIIVSLILGIPFSIWGWSSTESAYQTSLKTKKMEVFDQ